jgi:ankyrin repeat protein
MKYYFILLTFVSQIAVAQNQDLANGQACESLFQNIVSEKSLQKAIVELRGLRVKALSGSSQQSSIAKNLFNQKIKELNQYISKEEIQSRLKSIKVENLVTDTSVNPSQTSSDDRDDMTQKLLDAHTVNEFLAEIGKPLDYVESGLNHLHRAIYIGRADLVGPLIRAGLDPNPKIDSKNAFGYNPLKSAIRSGNLSMVKAFVESGANVNINLSSNVTPMHIAAEGGPKEILEFLINSKGDVNAVDGDGRTPLAIAIIQGRADNYELLVKAGANVKYISPIKYNLFHYAVYGNKANMISILVKAGIDINAKNDEGQTPLKMALELRDPTVAEELRKYGAKE